MPSSIRLRITFSSSVDGPNVHTIFVFLNIIFLSFYSVTLFCNHGAHARSYLASIHVKLCNQYGADRRITDKVDRSLNLRLHIPSPNCPCSIYFFASATVMELSGRSFSVP